MSVDKVKNFKNLKTKSWNFGLEGNIKVDWENLFIFNFNF